LNIAHENGKRGIAAAFAVLALACSGQPLPPILRAGGLNEGVGSRLVAYIMDGGATNLAGAFTLENPGPSTVILDSVHAQGAADLEVTGYAIQRPDAPIIGLACGMRFPPRGSFPVEGYRLPPDRPAALVLAVNKRTAGPGIRSLVVRYHTQVGARREAIYAYRVDFYAEHSTCPKTQRAPGT
jgi:hypothetical protein